MVALLNLHGVAESAGGARNDGYLLNGSGVCLFCSNKGVTNLVIGDYALFLIGENRVLFLVACNNNLNAFLKVGLRGFAPVVPDGTESRFVNYVCKLCAGSAGGHARNVFKVNARCKADFFCVDSQNVLATLEVGKLNGNAAVEPSGSCQRRIKRFRAVCCGKDNYAVVAGKAVHLGQKLVKGLLAFIVSAGSAVPFLSDGVNLINENNARCFFLGLAEKVAHL